MNMVTQNTVAEQMPISEVTELSDIDHDYERWEASRREQTTTDMQEGFRLIGHCDDDYQEEDTTVTSSDSVPAWEAFPLYALPDPLRQYCQESANAIDCDPSMIALPTLSSTMAAVGSSYRIEVKPGWIEPAVCWTAVISPAGSNKSTGLSAGTRFTKERHDWLTKNFREEQEAHRRELAEWEKLDKKERGPKPEGPVHRRVRVDNFTCESLIEILVENGHGLLVDCDELAGFFQGANQYKKQGNDVATYLQMFRAEPITYDRKVNPEVRYIPRANVSITGGIQPEIFKRLITGENTENGLLSRFLVCQPPDRPKQWSDDEVNPMLVNEMTSLFGWLYGLPLGENPIDLPLNAEARRRFKSFVNQHNAEGFEHGGALRAAYAKLEAYCARFALLFHLIEQVSGRISGNPNAIHQQSVESAIELIAWFARETQRVYRSLEGGLDPELVELVQLVRASGGRITTRELSHKKRKYRTSGAAEAVITKAVNAGLGRWEVDAETNGRPRTDFILT